MQELLSTYLKELDLGPIKTYRGVIETVANWTLPNSLNREITDLSEILGIDRSDLLLINLYYDLTNAFFRLNEMPSLTDLPGAIFDIFSKARPYACTSFAFTGSDGTPWHARNLDWWSDGRLLASESVLLDYQTSSGAKFSVLGWPGMVGAFTGIRKGAFTVSLNTVLSEEKLTMGLPLPMLIRQVLEECSNYAEAVKQLSETKTLSDGLLMVTGTKAGEMVVIERTPSQYALRYADKTGLLVATNSYEVVKGPGKVIQSELSASADGRRAGVCAGCAPDQRPKTLEGCLDVLRRADVQMKITMQRAVMRAADGFIMAEAVGQGC